MIFAQLESMQTYSGEVGGQDVPSFDGTIIESLNSARGREFLAEILAVLGEGISLNEVKHKSN